MEQGGVSHSLPFIKGVIDQLIDTGHGMLEGSSTKELEKLEGLRPTIDCILGGASTSMLREGPLKDLQEAIYKADDVLDNFEYNLLEARRKTGETKSYSSGSPFRCFLCFSAPENKSEVKNFDDIECLKGCIRSIIDAAEKCNRMFNFTDVQYNQFGGSWQFGNSTQRNNTRIINEDTALFGRDAEVQHILEIYEFSDDPRYRLGVGVLPIVGMPGVGKSALARIVFNHQKTKEEFSLRMWVYVSNPFDHRALMLQMMKTAKGVKELPFNSGNSTDEIQNELVDVLKEKRFLLVLDNVVDIAINEWEELHNVFKRAARRSLVVVTTQSDFVAKTVSTAEPINLQKLSGDDTWRLFKHFAIDGKDYKDRQEAKELSPMEKLGENIAKRLDGLPLSARALGTALHHTREENHWRNVLESQLWEQHEDDVPPALWLSYQHLNPSTKKCFAYCSVFPQDYVFEKEKVIQMWEAQGLVDINVGRNRQYFGVDSFFELTDRGFFQSIGDGRYVMHTLMQELAQRASAYDCFTLTDNSGDVPREVRHLSIKTINLAKIRKDLDLQTSSSDSHFLNQLRTLLFFGKYDDADDFTQIMEQIFSNLRSIRVIKLPFPCMPEVLRTTEHLKHMRYLDVSGNHISELPGSICRLYHMQVLNLQQCPDFSLPRNLINLVNLRYLYASTGTLSTLTQMQSLTSLQELERFHAGGMSGINALRGMQQLKGTLCIEALHDVKHGEAKSSILKATRRLNKLCLLWGSESHMTHTAVNEHLNMDEKLLECLQPHENLEGLEIVGYPGTGYPSWMLQRQFLKNVRCVQLSNCPQWKTLSPLHLLPNLELLEIKEMKSMEKANYFHQGSDLAEVLFPKLKKLVLKDLPLWVGWKINGTILFPCLQELEMRNCPQFTVLPPIPLSLKILTIENVGLAGLPMICEDKCCAEQDSSTGQSSLSSLYVSVCPSLKTLTSGLLQQQQLLRSLHSMEIRNCDNLESGLVNGLKDLKALANLSICDCPKLLISQFPESLQKLEISECFVLKGAWHDEYPHLFSVWTLRLYGCSHVDSELEHKEKSLDWMDSLFKVYNLEVRNTSFLKLKIFDKLRNLKILEIDGCKGFLDSKLSFESFRGLILLGIKNCMDLACLPEDISTLPELEELCIENCPLFSILPNSGFPGQLKRIDGECFKP